MDAIVFLSEKRGAKSIYENFYIPSIKRSEFKPNLFSKSQINNAITQGDFKALSNAKILIFDLGYMNDLITMALGYCYAINKERVIILHNKNDRSSVAKKYLKKVFLYSINDTKKLSESSIELTKRIKKFSGLSKEVPSLVVENYFKHVRSREFYESWNYLGDDLRVKFNDNVKDYERGYKKMIGIEKLTIYEDSVEENTAYYSVFYLDKTKTPVIDEIKNIGKKRLKDFSELQNDFEKLKKRSLKLGYIDTSIIDDLTLNQLNQSNLTYLVQHQLDLKAGSDKNERLYTTTNLAKTVFGFKVIVMQDNFNEWQITSILPLHLV